MPCSYQVAEKLVLKLATCGMRGAMLRGPDIPEGFVDVPISQVSGG